MSAEQLLRSALIAGTVAGMTKAPEVVHAFDIPTEASRQGISRDISSVYTPSASQRFLDQNLRVYDNLIEAAAQLNELPIIPSTPEITPLGCGLNTGAVTAIEGGYSIATTGPCAENLKEASMPAKIIGLSQGVGELRMELSGNQASLRVRSGNRFSEYDLARGEVRTYQVGQPKPVAVASVPSLANPDAPRSIGFQVEENGNHTLKVAGQEVLTSTGAFEKTDVILAAVRTPGTEGEGRVNITNIQELVGVGLSPDIISEYRPTLVTPSSSPDLVSQAETDPLKIFPELIVLPENVKGTNLKIADGKKDDGADNYLPGLEIPHKVGIYKVNFGLDPSKINQGDNVRLVFFAISKNGGKPIPEGEISNGYPFDGTPGVSRSFQVRNADLASQFHHFAVLLINNQNAGVKQFEVQ